MLRLRNQRSIDSSKTAALLRWASQPGEGVAMKYGQASNSLIFASILLLGVLLGAKLDTQVSAMFREEPVPTRYLDKIEILSHFPPQGSIAFYGDSHVERGMWREMTGLDIANFGVGGDVIKGVRKRLVLSGADRIILLIGINDLIAGRSPKLVAESVRELINETEKDFILVEVMPVRGAYSALNTNIEAANGFLEDGCKERCTFVRTWPSLSENGELIQDLTTDDLHLNARGYAFLSALVRQALVSD